MANIQERRDKTGKLISYSIRVHRGRGADGKQLKPWTATFEVSPTWTEKSAKKKAEAFAATFEDQCKKGLITDNRLKFGEYLEYVIAQKERAGAKHSTIMGYRFLATLITPSLGHLKLTEIRPDHLNTLYEDLAKAGSGKSKTWATAKIDLAATLKEKGFTRSSLAEKTGLGTNRVYDVINGKKVSVGKAKTVADALGLKFESSFTVEKESRTLSPKTIIECHRLVRLVIQQAVKEGLLLYNTADRATPPSLAKKEVDSYNIEQVGDILAALEEEPLRWKVLVTLFLVTGCRRGELAGLKWENVDFKQEQIYICNNLLYSPDRGVYEDTPKTKRSVRHIALPSDTMKLLKQYHAWQLEERLRLGEYYQDRGYVFTRDTGDPIHPDSISTWLARFSRRHSLPHIHAHAFRHTAATLLLYKGVDIATVAKRLGHAQVSTTLDVYSHVLEKADRESADVLGAIILQESRKGA